MKFIKISSLRLLFCYIHYLNLQQNLCSILCRELIYLTEIEVLSILEEKKHEGLKARKQKNSNSESQMFIKNPNTRVA